MGKFIPSFPPYFSGQPVTNRVLFKKNTQKWDWGWNGGFLKWWYQTTIGFPIKNDHFGVFWGYHHLRKHPNVKGPTPQMPPFPKCLQKKLLFNGIFQEPMIFPDKSLVFLTLNWLWHFVGGFTYQTTILPWPLLRSQKNSMFFQRFLTVGWWLFLLLNNTWMSCISCWQNDSFCFTQLAQLTGWENEKVHSGKLTLAMGKNPPFEDVSPI